MPKSKLLLPIKCECGLPMYRYVLQDGKLYGCESLTEDNKKDWVLGCYGITKQEDGHFVDSAFLPGHTLMSLYDLANNPNYDK